MLCMKCSGHGPHAVCSHTVSMLQKPDMICIRIKQSRIVCNKVFHRKVQCTQSSACCVTLHAFDLILNASVGQTFTGLFCMCSKFSQILSHFPLLRDPQPPVLTPSAPELQPLQTPDPPLSDQSPSNQGGLPSPSRAPWSEAPLRLQGCSSHPNLGLEAP